MKPWTIMLVPLLLAMPRSPAPQVRAGPTSNAVGSSLSDDYELVWADEFNTSGEPDARNWTFEHGFVRNREQQWYQPENARCEKGILVIEARRQLVQNADLDSGGRVRKGGRSQAEYTSASLLTKGLHQWMYGRFEMRGRIDTRPGLWAAFWTLGSARRWPGCGEIDIWSSIGANSWRTPAGAGQMRGSVGRFQETD